MQRNLFMAIMTIMNIALQIVTSQDVIALSNEQFENSSIENIWRKCELPQEEWPGYDYFINAQQGHYNLTLENSVAFIVKDYASEVGMDSEQWELKKIYSC